MMNDRRGPGQADAGLCARCAHVQIVASSRGSTFYLCGLSAVDSRFPRYPRLPVLACDGFRPREPSDARPRPLRVALLVDSLTQPAWVHRIVEDIHKSAQASVVLVVRNQIDGDVRESRLRRLWRNRVFLLYAAYSRIDQALFASEPDAFAPRNLEPLLAGVPVLDVRPARAKFRDVFEAADLDAIRQHDLDVALRFGFRILSGNILTLPRHGIWSYHHGDAAVNRGGPAGFWEVMQQAPTTGSVLQVLTEDLDNGRMLHRSWSATISEISTWKNKNNYYWKSASFVGRKLCDLAHDRLSITSGSTACPSVYSHPLYKPPTNRQMFGLLLGMASRVARRRVSALLYRDQWCLAYRRQPIRNGIDLSLHRFKYIVPPRDRFWADPFPVAVGDRTYIFVEEFLYATGRAHIAVIEMDADGHWKPPVPVLERPYHLSYPFTFEWNGTHYMIPEAAGTNAIELYRCTRFPFEWEFDRILMDNVRAADATLMPMGERWLMFVNLASPGMYQNWDELFLFFADTPMGPWTAHPRNPIKSDVRNCRPAGRLFRSGGDLYRPAQDCSGGYGRAVVLNKIVRCDEQSYVEEEVARIEPEWDERVFGVHTLNTAGTLTVVDCLMKRSRLGYDKGSYAHDRTGPSQARRDHEVAAGGGRSAGRGI
jgi:hypothetical protein